MMTWLKEFITIHKNCAFPICCFIPAMRSCTTLRLGAAYLSRQASREPVIDKSPAEDVSEFLVSMFGQFFMATFLNYIGIALGHTQLCEKDAF